jgi:CheY-like chemotaxis protein
MLSQFQDVLNVYLFPFVIAVPIAIVLYLLVTRRDEPPLSELNTSRQADGDSRGDTRFSPTLPPPYAAGRPGAVAAASGTTSLPAAGLAPQAAGGQLSTVEAAARLARGELPAHRPMAPELPPQAAAPAPAPSTLLLVDDSAVARAKLRKLFESAGYPVEVAKDGLEALELLGKNRYALMITDLEMPHMDGVELIAAVHGSLDTEDLPILAITGHDDLQAKVHECEGLFGIFKKPWNDRELLRRVETLVRLRSASATA